MNDKVDKIWDRQEFYVEICDKPEFEELYAEICYGRDTIAEVSQEQGYDSLDITFLPAPDGKPKSFKLKDFEDVIEKAKKRLSEFKKK